MKIQMRLADFSSIVLVLVPILATTEINGMLLVEIYRNSMMVPVDINELLRLISTRVFDEKILVLKLRAKSDLLRGSACNSKRCRVW